MPIFIYLLFLVFSINLNAVNLTELPTELHQLIVSNLPLKDILNFCLGSKKLKKACDSELFWEVVTKRDFGERAAPGEENKQGWKNIYKNRATISKNNAQYIKKEIEDGWSMWGRTFSKDDAYLATANLENYSFGKTTFQEACFFNASLQETNFTDAKLNRADFSKANLSKARLADADLSESLLIMADLTKAFLKNTNFSMANLTGANLFKANFWDTMNFSDANLRNAWFRRVKFPSKMNFSGANFSGADLTRAKYDARSEEELEKAKTEWIFPDYQPVTKEWLKKQGATWDEDNPPKGIE